MSDYYPTWSPDGTRIAFNSMRDGNPEIFVMAAGGPPDANGQTLLTNNPAADYYPNWGAPAIVPPMPMTYTALVPVVMGE